MPFAMLGGPSPHGAGPQRAERMESVLPAFPSVVLSRLTQTARPILWVRCGRVSGTSRASRGPWPVCVLSASRGHVGAGVLPDVHGRARVGADRMSYCIVVSFEVARSAGGRRAVSLPRVGPPDAVCAAARRPAREVSRGGSPARRWWAVRSIGPCDVSRVAGAPGVSPPRRVPQDRKSDGLCVERPLARGASVLATWRPPASVKQVRATPTFSLHPGSTSSSSPKRTQVAAGSAYSLMPAQRVET
jgi:hypothetical protein